MVNGRVSLVIYLGAWVCACLCVIGSVYLAAINHAAPTEIHDALIACFAVIAGTHVKAPLEALSTIGKAVKAATTDASQAGGGPSQ